MSGNTHEPVPLWGKDSDDSLRFVIVGDGYTKEELPQFARDAQTVTQMIRTTPPFDEMRLCIVRLDVASRQSSAYRSAMPDRADTYFQWQLDKRDHHALNVDQAKLASTVRDALPRHWGEHKILVLVNAPEVFAGGGIFSPHDDERITGVAIASNANGCETVLHELGHAFGLGDEYAAGPVMGNAPPNVASDPTRLPAFWRARLTPGVKRPTQSSDREVVGAFPVSRGRKRYRPQYSCIMKSASSLDRYCKVCADWIRETPVRGTPGGKAVQ